MIAPANPPPPTITRRRAATFAARPWPHGRGRTQTAGFRDPFYQTNPISPSPTLSVGEGWGEGLPAASPSPPVTILPNEPNFPLSHAIHGRGLG
jgi:hypothetical protein